MYLPDVVLITELETTLCPAVTNVTILGVAEVALAYKCTKKICC
jgi:hypothetical protein